MSKAAKAKDGHKPGFLEESIEIVKTVVYALLIALVIRTIFFQPYTIPSASMEPNLMRGDYIIVSKWNYGWSRHSILFSPPLFKGRIFFHKPSRGDIVVFKLPNDGNIDYIKRLVGLPGDRIQVRDGVLYVNDKAAKQKFIAKTLGTYPGDRYPAPVKVIQETNIEGRTYRTQDADTTQADNTDVYVVPAHCYFMMGDNRDNSADSRFDPGIAPEDPKLGGCGWQSSTDEKMGYATGVGFVPEVNLEGKAQIIGLSWDTGANDSDHSKAYIFNPISWFRYLRPSRFFHSLT